MIEGGGLSGAHQVCLHGLALANCIRIQCVNEAGGSSQLLLEDAGHLATRWYYVRGDDVHPTTGKPPSLPCCCALLLFAFLKRLCLPLRLLLLLLLLLLVCQAGERLCLEWVRGRVFDQDVGGLFAAAVREAGSLQVGHECHCLSHHSAPCIARFKLDIGSASRALHVYGSQHPVLWCFKV